MQFMQGGKKQRLKEKGEILQMVTSGAGSQTMGEGLAYEHRQKGGIGSFVCT